MTQPVTPRAQLDNLKDKLRAAPRADHNGRPLPFAQQSLAHQATLRADTIEHHLTKRLGAQLTQQLLADAEFTAALKPLRNANPHTPDFTKALDQALTDYAGDDE